MLKTALGRFVCALAAFSLVPPAYPSDKFPEYPVHPAGDYAVKTERADVTLGIQTVDDVKDQKAYFHTELTPKGYLPVFIVIQNGSKDESFLFDKTSIRFGEVDSGGTPRSGEKAGEVVAIGSLAALSIAGMFVALKLLANASQVQENILKKEVQSKTLSPGASAHGFLYVPVAKKGPHEKGLLRVPITKSGTDDTFVLEVVF